MWFTNWLAGWPVWCFHWGSLTLVTSFGSYPNTHITIVLTVAFNHLQQLHNNPVCTHLTITYIVQHSYDSARLQQLAPHTASKGCSLLSSCLCLNAENVSEEAALDLNNLAFIYTTGTQVTEWWKDIEAGGVEHWEPVLLCSVHAELKTDCRICSSHKNALYTTCMHTYASTRGYTIPVQRRLDMITCAPTALDTSFRLTTHRISIDHEEIAITSLPRPCYTLARRWPSQPRISLYLHNCLTHWGSPHIYLDSLLIS